MKLIEVTDRKTKKSFHALPKIIYKDDPNFTFPLVGMVEENFDRKIPFSNTESYPMDSN